MPARLSQQEGRQVIVRLSDVPPRLRQTVADELVRREKLRGLEAAEMFLAAYEAPSAQLRVPAWKAELVLREGKRPPGQTPKYG